jgi:hypothetical protein
MSQIVIAPRASVIWDCPNEFHYFHFDKTCWKPERGNAHQIVAAGKDSLSFGMLCPFCVDQTFIEFLVDLHACTERFFASKEMKPILAFYISNYEMQLLEKTTNTLAGSLELWT